MASKIPGIPAGRLAQYAMLVAAVPGLERRGTKTPYTSLNGNMSSFLTETGCLALRLDAEAREAFMRRHDTTLCERHGRTMREYVAVPEELWKDRTTLRRAFVASVAYVGTLKPKVAKPRKPAAREPAVSRTSETKEPSPRAATTRAKSGGRKAPKKKAARKSPARKATAGKRKAARS